MFALPSPAGEEAGTSRPGARNAQTWVWGRVHKVFQVGDRVLSRTDIGKLRPRWDCPFTAPPRPSPPAYTLELPRRMRCGPTATHVAASSFRPVAHACRIRCCGDSLLMWPC